MYRRLSRQFPFMFALWSLRLNSAPRAHLSLILAFLTFLMPVTSRSRCPTALLTNGGREQEKKETGVDGG